MIKIKLKILPISTNRAVCCQFSTWFRERRKRILAYGSTKWNCSQCWNDDTLNQVSGRQLSLGDKKQLASQMLLLACTLTLIHRGEVCSINRGWMHHLYGLTAGEITVRVIVLTAAWIKNTYEIPQVRSQLPFSLGTSTQDAMSS